MKKTANFFLWFIKPFIIYSKTITTSLIFLCSLCIISSCSLNTTDQNSDLVEPGVNNQTRLAVHTYTSGIYVRDSVWSSYQKKHLTFCIGNTVEEIEKILSQTTTYNTISFEDYISKSKLISLLQQAAQNWEDVIDVDFIYDASQDSACTYEIKKIDTEGVGGYSSGYAYKDWDPNYNVLFSVHPIKDPATYNAQAFWPHEDRKNRVLLIHEKLLQNAATDDHIVSVLTHELGHALGFQHEFAREEAGSCEVNDPGEGFRELTDFDNLSIMYYPWKTECNSLYIYLRRISFFDAVGAQAIYGASNRPAVFIESPIEPVNDVLNYYFTEDVFVSGHAITSEGKISSVKVNFSSYNATTEICSPYVYTSYYANIINSIDNGKKVNWYLNNITLPAGDYCIYAYAKNSYNTTSPTKGTRVTVSTYPGVQTSISSPTYSGNLVTVSADAYAILSSIGNRMFFYLDGTLKHVDAAAPFTFTFDKSKLPVGRHIITAVPVWNHILTDPTTGLQTTKEVPLPQGHRTIQVYQPIYFLLK